MNDYAELLERYQNGDFAAAVRELAWWPKRATEEATASFEARTLTDLQLKSAVLLHTEVILSTSRDVTEHMEAARHFLERITGDTLQRGLGRQWHLIVGMHLHHLNRTKEALSFLEPALVRFPRDEELLLATGAVYEAAGWMWRQEVPWLSKQNRRSAYSRAERLYRRLLEADSEHVEAHLRLGHVLKLKKRYKDALRELDWCLSHSRDPGIIVVAHLLRGDIHREKDESSKAVEDYRAALAIDPMCEAAATALSYCLYREGDLDGSRDVMRRFFEGKGDRAFEPDTWWRYLRGDRGKLGAMMASMRANLQ